MQELRIILLCNVYSSSQRHQNLLQLTCLALSEASSQLSAQMTIRQLLALSPSFCCPKKSPPVEDAVIFAIAGASQGCLQGRCLSVNVTGLAY